MKLLDVLGIATLQMTTAGGIRSQIWRALQPPWTICCEPRNPMPMGMCGVMRNALGRVEAGAQSILGLHCKTGITLRKMARWMPFALGWMAHYQKKKKKDTEPIPPRYGSHNTTSVPQMV